MNRRSYNYRKLWTDRAAPVDRASAFAYWRQARDFEQAARERGDVATANFQQRIRIERENRLLELDAEQGGNI